MNILRLRLERNALKEHYQQGMLKLLPVPVDFGMDSSNKEFFAYISALGGGLLEGDEHNQSFYLVDTKAVISSQASQKIYKGSSMLKTKIDLDDNSCLVYHNDANVFFANASFVNKTKINVKKNSKIFYVDGGFAGYADYNFAADMRLRFYIDYKLALNDSFVYTNKRNLCALYDHKCFYTIIIKGKHELSNINEEHLKAHASSMGELCIVRIASDYNADAIGYINDIKKSWLTSHDMSLTSIR